MALLACASVVGLASDFSTHEFVVDAPPQAALTSPAPSSVLTGPKVTFTWNTVAGATSYLLRLGTSVGGYQICGTGTTTATSATPTNLPTNGETIYARLYTNYGSSSVYTDYVFTAATPAALTSPAPSTTLAGPKVTFNWSAGTGATSYILRLGTSVGGYEIYGTGTTTATSATPTDLPTNGETIYARLYTNFGSSSVYTDYVFASATAAALTSPAPSTTLAGPKVTFNWSAGTGATSYLLRLGTSVGGYEIYGTGTTTATSATPTNLATNGETIYARLYTNYGFSSVYTDYVFTAATAAALTSPTPSTTLAGPKVTFNWSAGTGATSYLLRLGTSVGGYQIYGTGTTTATSATPTNLATNGETIYARLYTNYGSSSVYTDYTYSAVPTLTLSTGSVSFGMVAVGRTGNGTVTLTSSGTSAVTVTAGSLSGTGFTISGVTFPLTLNPGQKATLAVGFAPTTAGAANGAATLTSNSSTGTTSTISLSGTGQPVLSGLSCASGSMTGAGTDTCTATLNAAAGTGGQAVSLSINRTAVTVPSSVTVVQGATTASFTATVSAVSTAETATLTASSGGGTQTYPISLIVPVPTLTLQSTSVAFGDVTEGSPSYQSVTLTSSGTGAVTVSAGSVSGTGYTISGVTFPSTLNPGDTATLDIEFNPTTTGIADGAVTLTSNSSTGTTATISLTGTGMAASYEVNLTWDAPTDSSDPVAGYNIYRVVNGSSAYQLLNSSVNSSAAYTDTTVATSTSYTYYVVSVDAEGNESVPSNTFAVSIP